MKIKRALRFLRGSPTCTWNFEWQDQVRVLTGFSDSDWAGCARTRRSTSGGGIMVGSHLLTHWSRTQSCVALSSGEAELNGMLKCASEGLMLKYLMSEIGLNMDLHLRGDSSAAQGTLQRVGSGRVKHLETRQLWLQEKIQNGLVKVFKIPRSQNWADTLTHAWVQADGKHFASMGLD